MLSSRASRAFVVLLAAPACTSRGAAGGGADAPERAGDSPVSPSDGSEAAGAPDAPRDAAAEPLPQWVDPPAGWSEGQEHGPAGPCGQPRIAPAPLVRRAPYLQSVSTSDALVALTTTSDAPVFVEYGRSGDAQWRRAEAETERFPVTRTGDTQEYHAAAAHLVGLEPNATYCYRVLIGDEVAYDAGSLQSAWTTHDRPLRIVAVGDSGTGSPEQLAVAERLWASQPDIYMHLGDLAYGDGRYTEFEMFVFAVYAPMMARIPMWPTIGNHEYTTAGGQPYIDVFHLPEQARRPLEQEYYYSFDYGNVHFVSIDSNEFRLLTTLGTAGDDMLDWLAADLAASTAEWKIAFMHHPVWSSGSHGSTVSLQDLVVPVLEAHGVDLVLAGHDHHYERTAPLLGATAAPESDAAITYVVQGAGGAGLRPASGDWFTVARNDQIHSYLELVVHGCQATGRAIDKDGAELDRFVVDGCDDT